MKIKPTDSILILSHYYKRAANAGGPPQEMRDYFLPKVHRLVYIEHPFPYADDRRSSVTIYRDGQLETVSYTPALAGPQAWFYLADIFLTWYFLLKAGGRYDLCVALDNLNTLSVLPWRWLGRIEQLVFYTIDYTPKRFTNRVLNWLYLTADRWACYAADTLWILSERMTESRQANGLNTRKSAPAVVLPMGANLDRIRPLSIEKINRHQLIFVGHLLEKQGLQLVIEALPALCQKIKAIKLVVVGQGEYEPNLKKLADSLKVNDLIDWRGFIEKHEMVEELLCQSAIGLAPYLPSPENYTFYTDPGKPKLYLGCGLPVVITDVPAIAQVIAQHRAGLIVKPTSQSVTAALEQLLTDDAGYKTRRQNALALSKQYNTNTLISQAIQQTNAAK